MLTGDPFLNGALVAASLFNTILLAWLGLTVLLNSDRRNWGIWLGGGNLLLGATFFLSHTMILGLGLGSSDGNLISWWLAGAAPAIILPGAWYVAMLWYAGYWEEQHSGLRQRQRHWLKAALMLMGLGLLALALNIHLMAAPRSPLAQLRLFLRWSIAGLPLLVLAYSVYIILCIGLSLDALRQPGPSARVMGQLARGRARPWLAAAALSLLAVGLLVSGTMAWLAEETSSADLADVYGRSIESIAWLDLIIAALIGLSVLLLGQAVVSYEVFTGRTLPRRGLARHWYRMVILAAGYSLLVGASLAWELRSLLIVALTTLLMTLALALLSGRSFAERERTIRLLRPFLTSQHLYDRLLAPAAAEVDISQPFEALCGEVLGARRAYLAPLGPLAPLVGAPIAYPSGTEIDLPALGELSGRLESPETMTVALDPGHYAGAGWAVPLWSQRGLSGVLLLGEKRDGGLYAQEEIEIARISCERLLDTQASAEMGRRLMALQRERLVHNQLVDLRARRVLHDEVLPDLQAALIELSGAEGGGAAAGLLSDSHRRISDLLGEIPTVTAAEVARRGFVSMLRQAVDREFLEAFDEVSWQIEPAAQERANRLPAATAETLFYAAREAVRNAARHGRDRARQGRDAYCLQISLKGDGPLEVTIEDNGKGMARMGADKESGGQGLALYSTMMAVVGGSLTVDSVPGHHTCVRLSLPLAAAGGSTEPE